MISPKPDITAYRPMYDGSIEDVDSMIYARYLNLFYISPCYFYTNLLPEINIYPKPASLLAPSRYLPLVVALVVLTIEKLWEIVEISWELSGYGGSIKKGLRHLVNQFANSNSTSTDLTLSYH